MMTRCYSELKRLQTFEQRYEYLRLGGTVGRETFGHDRYLNQILYSSPRWKEARDKVILRDSGCDLGIDDREIHDRVLVHHMNAINAEDILADRDELYNPEFLVCTSFNTHQAIHYGDDSLLPKLLEERRPGDTTPWLGGDKPVNR